MVITEAMRNAAQASAIVMKTLDGAARSWDVVMKTLDGAVRFRDVVMKTVDDAARSWDFVMTTVDDAARFWDFVMTTVARAAWSPDFVMKTTADVGNLRAFAGMQGAITPGRGRGVLHSFGRRADGVLMSGITQSTTNLSYPRAMSNRERQRRFRERNPHYYRDLKRRDKARYEAFVVAQAEQERLLAEVKAQTIPGQLCLPAPEPVVTLDMLLAGYAPPAEKVAVRVAEAA